MFLQMDNWVVVVVVTLVFCFCLALVFLLLLPRFSPASGGPERGGKKKKKTKTNATTKGRPPPSPSSLPIIGNLMWLRRPLLDLSPAIRQLAAEYGPVVSLRIGPFPAVFIADAKLAHEALVVKGAAFADRPAPLGANYVYSSDGHVISSGSGALWRLLRRNLSAEVLHPTRLRSFAPGRRWALGKLLRRLGAEAAEAGGVVAALAESLRNPVFSLLVYMCFGEKLGEKVIDDIKDVQREVLRLALGLNVFDLMPRVGKLLFWKRWKRFLSIRRRQEDILIPLIRARRDKKACGGGRQRAVVPYVDTLLDLELPDEGGRKLDDAEIVSLCSEFFNAGTDTTLTTLQWAMANLVRYPHIQHKLFEEIRGATGVHGGGRGEIGEEELERMAYLRAVILETLRLHPPAHFLLPHVVSEEAVSLGGYLMSKGAVVNVTTAEFGWDEEVWECPMEFRPERFLPGGEGHGVDITGSREIKMMPFGAGRRICPGLGPALLHLGYFIAGLVGEYEWKAMEGEVVDLSAVMEFTVTMKTPLRARISPRLDGRD